MKQHLATSLIYCCYPTLWKHVNCIAITLATKDAHCHCTK